VKDGFLKANAEAVNDDPGRLGQVISNLVSNTLKFTATGGASVHVHCINDGNNSLLAISASHCGRGIPEDKVDLLFEAFSQTDSSTTHGFGGCLMPHLRSTAQPPSSRRPTASC
jgi:signal transduction histidine kinase